MTLGEVLEFMSELDEGKHSQYDVPVQFHYEKLYQEVQEIVTSNENNFILFLVFLYSAYRKIEMQMEKTGYPGILADLESQEKSLDLISSNLKKAKDEYKTMKNNLKGGLMRIFSKSEIDFLEMYPVLKKLFSCYTDYIRYAMNHTNKIDEGDHLPGSYEEIQSWLENLNTWSPERVSIENINWMKSFVVMPSGYEQVIQTLIKTTKFTDYCAVIDNQGTEPFIRDRNKRILFGFVNMDGARTGQNSDNASMLEVECLKECTVDTRRWICTKCGNYVSIKENQVKHQYLFCSCGSKKYNDNLLICHHPSHQSQKYNGTQNSTLTLEDLLSKIRKKLQKFKIKNKGVVDIKIYIAINYISNKKTEEDIRNALENLNDLALDKNIREMINLYLKNATSVP